MINLSGILIEHGETDRVQLSLVGEDGVPAKFEYVGKVYIAVTANTSGHLSLQLTVRPRDDSTTNSHQSHFER